VFNGSILACVNVCYMVSCIAYLCQQLGSFVRTSRSARSQHDFELRRVQSRCSRPAAHSRVRAATNGLVTCSVDPSVRPSIWLGANVPVRVSSMDEGTARRKTLLRRVVDGVTQTHRRRSLVAQGGTRDRSIAFTRRALSIVRRTRMASALASTLGLPQLATLLDDRSSNDAVATAPADVALLRQTLRLVAQRLAAAESENRRLTLGSVCRLAVAVQRCTRQLFPFPAAARSLPRRPGLPRLVAIPARLSHAGEERVVQATHG
jgi:hypothetical protein